MAREPKSWGQAAFGGLLVALGGALFGFGRSAKRSAETDAATISGKTAGGQRSRTRRARPAAGASKVRTKPQPKQAPPRTLYWPPPAPKPIEDAAEGGDPVPKPVDRRSVELGYERVDVKAGKIVAVMLVSVTVIVGAISVLFYLIGTVHRGDAASRPMTPQQTAVIVPPGPHLQDHPLHDIAMERQRESDLLKFYAWADPQHRTARIPIARAEALVTGRSLDPQPADPAASPAPAAPAPQP